MTNPRYLTVAQVAEELHVCRETVYSWVRDGRIAVFRLGGIIRIPREALEEFVTPASAPPPSLPDRSRDTAARLRAQNRLKKKIVERRQR